MVEISKYRLPDKMFSRRNKNLYPVKFKTMPFGFIILIRILFSACMVFIIGYVFGNFSASATLTTITRVGSILAIVLFVSANIFLFRFSGWQRGNFNGKNNCGWYHRDTIANK
jgi:hypothetical protein